MKIYRIAQEDPDIKYLGSYKVGGLDFVLFRIEHAYWAYQLSFPDWVAMVKQIAARSGGKALAWAKKKAGKAYLVTEDFPMPGTILREEE